MATIGGGGKLGSVHSMRLRTRDDNLARIHAGGFQNPRLNKDLRVGVRSVRRRLASPDEVYAVVLQFCGEERTLESRSLIRCCCFKI